MGILSQEVLKDFEEAKILIEAVKVWQEGKVKPNSSRDHTSSTIVRDAKEATKYIDAANERIAELLNLNVK